ncbi:MAG: response regulator, partial [Acidobacteria bacterium]
MNGTAMPEQTRILIVDDDEDFLFQHRIQLENAGFKVEAAGSRTQAEQAISSFTPDLAILDLMMEHHDDGFVLSHHLKRRFPNLPVILVTAVTSETGLVFDPASPEERSWIGA